MCSSFSLLSRHIAYIFILLHISQGRIQDFKLGGAHLKKLRRAEGGAKNVGVFRVKKSRFYAKKSYFSNFRGGAQNFWGISCEKSRFYAKKIIFFPILGGRGRRVRAPPLESAAPVSYTSNSSIISESRILPVTACVLLFHSYCETLLIYFLTMCKLLIFPFIVVVVVWYFCTCMCSQCLSPLTL
jgi:hypothetical protein